MTEKNKEVLADTSKTSVGENWVVVIVFILLLALSTWSAIKGIPFVTP